MLNWFKRWFTKPTPMEPDNRLKCPTCETQNYEWVDARAESSGMFVYEMKCENGHLSNWIDTGFMGVLAPLEKTNETQ